MLVGGLAALIGAAFLVSSRRKKIIFKRKSYS
ncbi:LPXTG cell wall anchor domain-containing protein [Staphylococcus sp. HMSC056G08]